MKSKPNLSSISAIVLAGGKGTRMKSGLPKVLHTIDGKPMILHTLETLKQLNLKQILIVVGYKKEVVMNAIGKNQKFVAQNEPLGTGHAVKVALSNLDPQVKTVMVLNGDDSAFYKVDTLKSVIAKHLESQKMVTLLTIVQKNVDISGRVIRDKNGEMIGIKANDELSAEELNKNNELLCGFYLFKRDFLEKELPKVKPGSNGEYPLPALIVPALRQSSLQDITLKDQNEWKGINTQRELLRARKIWKKRGLNV